jgi:hypothetical protein
MFVKLKNKRYCPNDLCLPKTEAVGAPIASCTSVTNIRKQKVTIIIRIPDNVILQKLETIFEWKINY